MVVATFLDVAAFLSITARQPAESWALCLYMQAVIAGMFGISELQNLKASPVHCACASELKAKLWLVEITEAVRAKASTKPAWRSLLVKAVMFGSC